MSATGATLDERVAALENALGALQGSESLNPNYLTLTPGGKVGAIFPGGVETTESTGSFTTETGLGWLNANGDGAIVEQIYGFFDGVSAHNLIATSLADSNDKAGILLVSDAAGAAGSAMVEAAAEDNAGGSQSVTVINSAGASSFLQLAGGARPLAIAAGSSLLTFSGGSTSNTVTINHGLTRTPIAMVATALAAPGFSAIPSFNCLNETTTQFEVNGVTPGSAITGNVAFCWIAIG